MGVLRQLTGCFARGLFALGFGIAWVLTPTSAACAAGSPQRWTAAVQARLVFEAGPAGTHTREQYTRVLDGFREIYHADPADPHAARAVEQVAELLVEQGHELQDTKSLQDAAGQYEFLARAYPSSVAARDARAKAAALLAPEAAAPEGKPRHVAAAELARPEASPAPETPSPVAPATAVVRTSAPAMVSAIRHWSTPSYTRVAIDLGDEVQFQAARVQNPDRIFFDLHHARLAPQLAGKSFAVTDEGFLTRIRAAQFSDEVTRVVLDVHEVAEYSAFLLPNPYRLIIDIHGKPEEAAANASRSPGSVEPPPASNAAEAAAASKTSPAPTETSHQPDAPVASSVSPRQPAPKPSEGDHYVPRRNRGVPQAAVAREDLEAGQDAFAGGGRDVGVHSSLPPMPVTDGGAAFGLPARKSGDSAGSSVAVAAPRVVIPSRATTARPVPNTVATHSAAASTEVAAVSEQPGKVEATATPTSQPVVDVANRTMSAAEVPATPSRGKKNRTTNSPDSKAAPAIAAPPTADGETSLLRALGLKIGRIVIDAGHGGHDSGTLGVDGLEEKEVVLDVALRLGKLLHDRLGAEIVYTRADDTFIPLETRTAIANKAQADLFISVHANSSPDPTARGVEVYYLNFTSDPEAMQVASRENAVSTKSVHELSELVRKITLKDKIEESHELAADVDSSLYAGLAKGNGGNNPLKDRGVKKAPFVVLIGANMPSILAEISFVTNPGDANKLGRSDYRQRVAESLYAGVARYAGKINGRRSAASVQTAER